MTMNSKFINIIVFIVWISFGIPDFLFAQSQYANPQEIVKIQMKYLTLPDYCQARLLERDVVVVARKKLPPQHTAVINKFRNQIGGHNWTYFHHFCFGIGKTKSALSSLDGKNNNKIISASKFKDAKSEFDFVKNRFNKSFPFWNVLYEYERFIDENLSYLKK